MAEMASWFKTKEGVIHLTDDDVIAYHETKGHEHIDWNNFVGHGGLMRVFNISDTGHVHHEGFVGMPEVIKKQIFDGKMDMMVAHASNLREATPEFIPTLKRLANRFVNVKRQLQMNPYIAYVGKNPTIAEQMKMGVKHGFNGSTIGQLLRQDACDEGSMLCALKGARRLMDEHTDHHHYHDIIGNPFVTKVTLEYILKHIMHGDVQENVQRRLARFKERVYASPVAEKKKVKTEAEKKKEMAHKVKLKIERVKKLKITVIQKGDAKIRVKATV